MNSLILLTMLWLIPSGALCHRNKPWSSSGSDERIYGHYFPGGHDYYVKPGPLFPFLWSLLPRPVPAPAPAPAPAPSPALTPVPAPSPALTPAPAATASPRPPVISTTVRGDG
ncbi:selenoprotein V-like [Cyprinus carpio]|uniref:Selenoprotein V-like n=1 Tax=Cyprinus carpio TaxID=7962 RepID=A0A9Q9ZTM4_CYPCA|nr:selenoprotein V-like [Cyprinus carpio]